MPGKKQGHSIHHNGYRGPWPEQRSSIPGRDQSGAAESGGGPREATHPVAPVHKIPQQAPKPK